MARARPGAVSYRKEGWLCCVTDTDIARSPAYPSPMRKHRCGGGEDVCYFVVRRYGAERVRGPHAERRFARKGSNSIARSPPTLSTIRGEDRCYIV